MWEIRVILKFRVSILGHLFLFGVHEDRELFRCGKSTLELGAFSRIIDSVVLKNFLSFNHSAAILFRT